MQAKLHNIIMTFSSVRALHMRSAWRLDIYSTIMTVHASLRPINTCNNPLYSFEMHCSLQYSTDRAAYKLHTYTIITVQVTNNDRRCLHRLTLIAKILLVYIHALRWCQLNGIPFNAVHGHEFLRVHMI